MKKKLISWLLTIVMLLGMIPVMELPASAASSTPTIVTSKLTTNMELQDNTIYVVNESYMIGGEIDKNGLRVKEGAKAGDGENGSVGNGIVAGDSFGGLTSVTVSAAGTDGAGIAAVIRKGVTILHLLDDKQISTDRRY